MRRVVCVAVAALLAAGCATPAGTAAPSQAAYTIHVLNVSGPPVEVLAVTRVLASVPCGSGTDIRSDAVALPPTPWEIVVRRADDGSPLARSNVLGPNDVSVQVRGATATIADHPMTGGPSVAPDACSSWSPPPQSSAPGAQAPSPKPYEQTFGPDYPAQPPAGQLTHVDDAAISADGRTLTLGFTGGLAYTPGDFCSTDYAPWVASAGADLNVAVALVPHPDQATAPPNGACADVGHGYTFHLLLAAPFAGSTVHDLAGGTLWVRAPAGLVEPQSLPPGWQLAYSGDEPAAEPPLFVRVYAPASSHVSGDNGGRGQLDLYEAFGAATQIGGGPERSTVQVGGSSGVLLHEPATGEMLLQWMVGPDGVALVGNEADMTLDQLLGIARSVKPAGG